MRHISPSQLNMFFKCGEQYRRRYIDKDIKPPGFALHRGKAVHGAAETNNRQKITTHADLAISSIVEVAAAEYERSIEQNGLSLSKDEQGKGLKKVRGEYLDQSVSLAELWGKSAAPLSQPTHVEQKIFIPVNDDYQLMGILDMIDDAGLVVDIKTGKRKTQNDLDTELQFTFYSLAYESLMNKQPKGIAIDQLIPNKTPIHERASTARTVEDYAILVNRINIFIKNYEQGNFIPAPPSAWWCDENWCGYALTCPYYRKRS